MFDTTSNITIELRVEGAGKTEIPVRWPSDEEWATHRRRSKTILRQLGRGASEMETDSGAADLKLYEAIKVDGAPPLTTGEATTIIRAIGRCEVVGVDLGAAEAEVQLQILTGKATHCVRIPTMDQARKLQRTNRQITLPYNCFQIQTSLDAGAKLWDDCSGKAEGYTGAVPNLHKDEVIRRVIVEIEQEATARYDEANF